MWPILLLCIFLYLHQYISFQFWGGRFAWKVWGFRSEGRWLGCLRHFSGLAPSSAPSLSAPRTLDPTGQTLSPSSAFVSDMPPTQLSCWKCWGNGSSNPICFSCHFPELSFLCSILFRDCHMCSAVSGFLWGYVSSLGDSCFIIISVLFHYCILWDWEFCFFEVNNLDYLLHLLENGHKLNLLHVSWS